MLILGDIELCRGIPTPVSFLFLSFSSETEGNMLTSDLSLKLNHGDFTLVLRLDGRIVVITEEAEHHLGKSMVSVAVQAAVLDVLLVSLSALIVLAMHQYVRMSRQS